MATINPAVTLQTQTPAFRGGQKKSVEVIGNLVKNIPDNTLMQTALKDIRKPVSEEAYAAAHKKAGKFVETVNERLAKGAAKDIYKK